jgi:hypothetical protein
MVKFENVDIQINLRKLQESNKTFKTVVYLPWTYSVKWFVSVIYHEHNLPSDL